MKLSLALLFAGSIVALFAHGYIWSNALEDAHALCLDTVRWGGDGGASAQTISAVLFFVELSTICGLLIYYLYVRFAPPIKTVEELRQWRYGEAAGNLTLVTAFCITLFFSGYIVSVLGNHAATSLLTIHGCSAEFSYDYMWLPWVGVGSILLVAYAGHAMIPETTSNARERAWSYNSYDNVPARAYSKRKVNLWALSITIILSFATVACLWTGFGIYHSNISRSEDGEELLCNCANAVNQTLCNSARVSLFDTLEGVNGAAWWTLGAAAIITAFLLLTFIFSRMGSRRSWLTIPSVRNLCIVLTAVALSVNGYAVGSSGGAPTLQLHELCCPEEAVCLKSITTYPSAVLAVVSFVLWSGAIISGHFIGRFYLLLLAYPLTMLTGTDLPPESMFRSSRAPLVYTKIQ